jgi:hypothetical protein
MLFIELQPGLNSKYNHKYIIFIICINNSVIRMAKKIKNNFNAGQSKAVSYTSGPLLILAGPGRERH